MTGENAAVRQQLAIIADSLPALVSLIDREGRYRFVNETYHEWFGHPPSDIIGKRMPDVLGESAYAVLAPYVQTALAGTVVRFNGRLPYKDGGARHVEITYTPYRVDDRVDGFVALVLDVTERERAAEEISRARAELATSNARLRVLTNASRRFAEAGLDLDALFGALVEEVTAHVAEGCGVSLVSDDGAWLDPRVLHDVDAEAATLMRAMSATAGRVPSSAGFSGRVITTNERFVMSTISRDAFVSTAIPAMRPLAERFVPTSIAGAPLRTGNNVYGAVVAYRRRPETFSDGDIALLDELASLASLAIANARSFRAVQEALRARDAFVAIAGHELRTPLTSLQLLLENALKQAESAGKAALSDAQFVHRIRKANVSVGRLQRLAFELLDVTRISSGRLELFRESLDLRELVREVAERFAETAERVRSELVVRADDDSDSAHAVVGTWDRTRLDHIVTNLVENALKYGAGKPVEIAVRREGDVARLSVTDHGIGISANDRERIFGRFERAVSERHYGGLGLGLWITRQLVEAHGGSVEVESAPAEGASFIVKLPLA